MGGRVPQTGNTRFKWKQLKPSSTMYLISGRDLDPVLDRDPPARPPAVAGQGADPDGEPQQPHLLRVVTTQHRTSPPTTFTVT